jgi:hypothetical protein
LTALLDDDDIDWLDEQVADLDLDSLVNWNPSPDGPHARTRRRRGGENKRRTKPNVVNKAAAVAIADVGGHGGGGTCSLTSGVKLSDNNYRLRKAATTRAVRDMIEKRDREVMVVEVGAAGVPVCGASGEGNLVNDVGGAAFTPLQKRQMFAQVQAHAQLLMQTFALAVERDVPAGLGDEMGKRWGWTKEALGDGPLRNANVRRPLHEWCIHCINQQTRCSRSGSAQVFN